MTNRTLRGAGLKKVLRTGNNKISKVGKVKTKFLAMVLSAFVLLMLFIAGPAQAFILGLSVDNETPNKGDIVKFTLSVEIKSDERLPIEELGVLLRGPVDKICVFDLKGKSVYDWGCEGMTITPLTIPDYSYGYGYGYYYDEGQYFGYGYGYEYGSGPGILSYEIALDTTDYLPGIYTTELAVIIESEGFTNTGDSIEIISPAITDATEIQMYSGEEQTLDMSDVGVVLEIKTDGSSLGNVVVNKYSTDPNGNSEFGIPALNRFIEIDADSILLPDLSEVIIKVYYTDTEVSAANLVEDTLRLYYYNASSDSWEKYDSPNGGVNTADNYVWANTTHFSTWGIFGNAVQPPNNPDDYGGDDSSGGGCTPDWQCTKWTECSSEGIQTRTCENNKPSCNKNKPLEMQECNPVSESEETETETEEVEVLTGEETGIVAGITGAIIGVFESLGKGKPEVFVPFMLIVLIVILAITVAVVRRVQRKKAIARIARIREAI